MSIIRTKKRDKMPAKEFGLPGERKYPMPDRAHAANAKARASQQEAKGNITPAEKAEIDRKADKKLGHDPRKLGKALKG